MKTFLNETKKEVVIAGLFLTSFLWLPPMLRHFDPTAGVVDYGVLHMLALAGFKLYCAVFLSWGVTKLLFPTLAHFAASGQFASAFHGMAIAEGTRSKVALTAGTLLTIFLATLATLAWA